MRQQARPAALMFTFTRETCCEVGGKEESSIRFYHLFRGDKMTTVKEAVALRFQEIR